MESYVRFVVKHRVAVVVAILVTTLGLGTQLRHVHLEIRQQALIPQDHPYVQVQNRIADLFGGETTLVVGIIPRHGDIFTRSVLDKIIRITRRIEQLPDVVPTNVHSLAADHVKFIRATPEGVDFQRVLEAVPATADGIAALRRELLAEPLYNTTLIGRGGSGAIVIADFNGDLPDKTIVANVEAAIAPERDADTDVVIGGAPMIRASVGRYTALMAVLFPIAILVIGLVHYEAFRTVQGMVLPLLTAVLSVVWALGIVGASGGAMDTWTAITPVVILAVAAGHAVQILKRYYEEYAACGDGPEAVVRSVTAVGPVMLTAGLIASAGFASLMTFEVASVREFGFLLSAGILSALVIELTFTPALRALLPPPRAGEVRREAQWRLLDRALDRWARMVTLGPRVVLATGVIIASFFCFGVFRVHVDNSFKAWFPSDSPLRTADALLNERLAGTSTLTLLVDGDHDGAIENPAVLRAVADLETFISRQRDIGAVSSIADFVKRMNQAMHGGAADAYAIPDNQRLVSEYLLLYSMSGPNDLGAIVDAGYRNAVIRAYAKRDDAGFARDLFAAIEQFVAARFAGLPVRVRLAGGALGVQTAMNDVIVHDKIYNVVQVALIIFLLSALALRSVVGGAIAVVPIVLAVLIDLGTMGWTATPLSIATAAVTAMGASIGADFAIYLLFRIREESRRQADIGDVVRTSLMTSGKAVFFVSSAVVLGYSVLPLSRFGAWVYLGGLTALLVGASAAAALAVIPALVLLLRPKFLVGAASARAGFPGSPVVSERAAAAVRHG